MSPSARLVPAHGLAMWAQPLGAVVVDSEGRALPCAAEATVTSLRWGVSRPLLIPGSSRRGAEPIEAIEVHDLVPRSHEVTNELRLGVVRGVDLGECPEL